MTEQNQASDVAVDDALDIPERVTSMPARLAGGHHAVNRMKHRAGEVTGRVPARPGSWQPRRASCTLRRQDHELAGAGEAMPSSAREPRPRPQADRVVATQGQTTHGVSAISLDLEVRLKAEDRVRHGQERGRHVDQSDPAQAHMGEQPGHIPGQPAAEGHHDRPAGRTVAERLRGQPLYRGDILVLLPGPDPEQRMCRPSQFRIEVLCHKHCAAAGLNFRFLRVSHRRRL